MPFDPSSRLSLHVNVSGKGCFLKKGGFLTASLPPLSSGVGSGPNVPAEGEEICEGHLQLRTRWDWTGRGWLWVLFSLLLSPSSSPRRAPALLNIFNKRWGLNFLLFGAPPFAGQMALGGPESSTWVCFVCHGDAVTFHPVFLTEGLLPGKLTVSDFILFFLLAGWETLHNNN